MTSCPTPLSKIYNISTPFAPTKYPNSAAPTHAFWSQVIDFFYGLCINDTDLQKITKNWSGRITKTEVADFWLL